MVRFVLAVGQAFEDIRVEDVLLGTGMPLEVLPQRIPQGRHDRRIPLALVVELGEPPAEEFVFVEDQVADVRHDPAAPRLAGSNWSPALDGMTLRWCLDSGGRSVRSGSPR